MRNPSASIVRSRTKFRKKPWRNYGRTSRGTLLCRFVCVFLLALELACLAWRGEVSGLSPIRTWTDQRSWTSDEEEEGMRRYGIRFRAKDGVVDFYREEVQVEIPKEAVKK